MLAVVLLIWLEMLLSVVVLSLTLLLFDNVSLIFLSIGLCVSVLGNIMNLLSKVGIYHHSFDISFVDVLSDWLLGILFNVCLRSA